MEAIKTLHYSFTTTTRIFRDSKGLFTRGEVDTSTVV